MPTKPSNEIFRALNSKNQIAHYTPDPNQNLPAEYPVTGVSIGDVGTWNEGSFEVIFNGCWSANHPINTNVVPDDFTNFPLGTRDVSKRSFHAPGSIIANAKVTKVSLTAGASSLVTPSFPATAGSTVTFKLQSKECAILVLPEGATRERLLPLEKFRKHVAKHAQEWYALAGDRLAPKDHLFVVTGCDKAASWGIATASTTSGGVSASLKFAVVGVAGASLSPQYEWQDFGSATVRTSRDRGLPRMENQSVFIRGFFVPKKAPLLTLTLGRFRALWDVVPRARGRISLEIKNSDDGDNGMAASTTEWDIPPCD
ncbi:hypothetical protein DFH07DRAFT_342110 [Mycena maculata]|uniref:Uncharacterized protein n=1 Tax=Mycena maculata TaxID=230809 RepID=A0AAD7MHE7_9AGAR|nr:hypothetical protein DFH07DRAFT_342110 [Mycena maculata]